MIPSLKVIAALLLTCSMADAKAPSELIKLDSLTTTRGKTYRKLIVRDITPSGIKIVHNGGTATLHYEEIPADLRERLGGFDPEEARLYDEEQERKAKEQQEQIERDLRKMEEDKKKDEKPAPATDENEGDEKVPPTSDEDEESTPAPDKEDEDEKPVPKPKPAPSGKAAPASPEEVPADKVDKGTLTARVIGYKTGVKRVEFSVITNCDAKLTVHNIPPYHHSKTFDVTANTPFVREIWVYNDYKSELLTPEGKKLDYENRTKKTETGRLTPAKLR
ncbi:MAG TPA: hypothetical protein VGE67_09560 [Haloferula sp.]